MRKFAFAAAFLLSAGLAGAQQVKLLEEDATGPAAQPAAQEDMPQVILPSEEKPEPAPVPAEAKPAAKPAAKKAKAAPKKTAKAAAPAAKPAATATPVPAAKAEAVKPEVKPAAAPPAAKAEARPAAPAGAKEAVKSEVKPAAAPEAAKPEPKPVVKAEAKPEVKPAAAKPEPKPAVKAGTKPEVKPAAAKPEPKPVVKAEAKPEVKPAAAAKEEPKAPAAEPAKGSGFSVQKTHTVTGGDTLWDLSNKYYKDPYKWGKIYNANLNRVNNPDLIYPKNELLIPDLTEEVRPEVKPEPRPAPVIAGGDTVKEPELQAEEIPQPEEPPAPLPTPGRPAAAELKEALAAYDRSDLSEEMPDHQKEWTGGVRIVPDGWQEDGVITAKESADDDSMDESLSLDGAVLKISMARSGAKPGDYLTVYMIGSDAFDKNGKRLGRELQRAGLVEVLESDGRKVKARVIEAVTAIVKGYVVKKK